MGRKLLTSPGVADMDSFLMNIWSTLRVSYQQRVYENTLATVKCRIQQAENPTPAEVISMDVARVENAIPLDYLTSGEALEQPEIRRTDPNILIDNKCMDVVLFFGMTGGNDDYDNQGDNIDESDAIPTISRRRRAATELERFHLGNSDVDGYEGDDGDDTDADEKEEALQAEHGSMQNSEDWGHSIRECEDWTVYFRAVKYDNGKANAMVCDVSEAKTVL